MSQFCGAHRPPRAGIDPVDTAAAALAVIQLAMHRPRSDETIALVLDDDHRGRTVVVVDGTDDPDAVLDVVERVAESIAATGRDGVPRRGLDPAGRRPDPGDDDRWLEASDIADDAGVELLEWFVIAGDAGAAHGVVPARPARRAATVRRP